MTDAKHTPGPWFYDGVGYSDGKHWVVGNVATWSPRIACIPPYDGEPSEANARLISAAPELLAELKAVREQCLFDDGDGIGVSEDVVIPGDMFDRICDAINKAEGRS